LDIAGGGVGTSIGTGALTCGLIAGRLLAVASGGVASDSRAEDDAARVSVEIEPVGPIGAVPREVDGIFETGRPEIGDTPGCAGADVIPEGRGTALVFGATGAAGAPVAAAGKVSGDWLGMVGDVLGAAEGTLGATAPVAVDVVPVGPVLLVPVAEPVPVEPPV
jgi:hypothetical protein